MRLIPLLAVAAAAALAIPAASAAPAPAPAPMAAPAPAKAEFQRHHNRRATWRTVCRTKWRHGHRVRTCRRVRTWR